MRAKASTCTAHGVYRHGGNDRGCPPCGWIVGIQLGERDKTGSGYADLPCFDCNERIAIDREEARASGPRAVFLCDPCATKRSGAP